MAATKSREDERLLGSRLLLRGVRVETTQTELFHERMSDQKSLVFISFRFKEAQPEANALKVALEAVGIDVFVAAVIYITYVCFIDCIHVVQLYPYT